MKKILTCVGTRPNLIKITQLDRWFAEYPQVQHALLHTGQHYDDKMNDIFFRELGIRRPDVHLHIPAGTQVQVISAIMTEFEKYITANRPDLVMVPGDVNSTFACAFVAQRHGIPVAHIESGLRSFDMTMPEEANRILVDALADLFFITEESGRINLLKEGKPEEKMVFTGNTMIDSLVAFMPVIEKSTVRQQLGLHKYYLLTFHRPVNVDEPKQLTLLCEIIRHISQRAQVVFPVHPRTRLRIQEFGINSLLASPNIILTEPFGYLDFIHLAKYAMAVITDSGGVQEETTYMGVPCITVRPSTERPVTVTEGTNTLARLHQDEILSLLTDIENGNYKKGNIPKLWDGFASKRLVEAAVRFVTA
ncbi:MAG: UDP-N-acetylglucosamine 2-epimerase (non-hydrolyzing) [Chitinophagales bacterium]|nr:UDP-N-acetylglucosamine 2-epimerase (non-hydrolyzing) [Chitinophagales bacterium]MDW8418245.1 UDP-N-acetylglucosamine 2-epimerase (non-hydrolyzing) [Chitinophagales bacterium]